MFCKVNVDISCCIMTCHISLKVYVSDVYPADQNNNAPSDDNLKGDISDDVLKKWKLTGFLKKSPARKSQSKFWFLNLSSRILSELLLFGVLFLFFFWWGGGGELYLYARFIYWSMSNGYGNWLIISECGNN